jgi:hypothetical protein
MGGKQIKLFLVDGTAGGLTTAEITNWTGHVLSARRSDLADLLKGDEAQRTGVCFLLGDDEWWGTRAAISVRPTSSRTASVTISGTRSSGIGSWSSRRRTRRLS